jgi:H(+)-translocating pyrophosphatase
MLEIQAAYHIVLGCCAVGIIYGILNYLRVRKVTLRALAADGDYTPLDKDHRNHELDKKQVDQMLQIGEYISNGAKAFLHREYLYVSVFLIIFTFIVWGACDSFSLPWTAVCFIAGGVTSVVSGYIGMMVAVQSNYRTAFEARRGLAPAFKVAFRAGCVMGFILSSLALLVLLILIALFKPSLETSKAEGFEGLQTAFDKIAGYGLGGSTVALFGRVGGGIYTKAADVGADLVGKVEEQFAEDSPQNPATIADNVGDNVGDIAGMGADLFGSFAEASSAALVVLSDRGLAESVNGIAGATQVYLFAPLLLSAFGIICCLITSVFATENVGGRATEN